MENQKELGTGKIKKTKESKTSSGDYRLDKKANWVNNEGNEVEEVFGFNQNAELVNARAAMFGFLMLIITELIYKGVPATHSIFGIG
tara:strand:+ start:306 stop:566 length:261 start_codon:yes stop_codon:yes gene_type:complete